MKSAGTSRFRKDHPVRQRNVFLMMGFDPSPMRSEIYRLIVRAGDELGFDVIRADDRDYSGELWTNAEICHETSTFGIPVCDRDDQSAQNLSVELGYLFARGAPCLILREAALPIPPAMLAHRLHTRFEAFDLEASLLPAVKRWLGDGAGRSTHRFVGVR